MQQDQFNIQEFIDKLKQLLQAPTNCLEESVTTINNIFETVKQLYEQLNQEMHLDFTEQQKLLKQNFQFLGSIEKVFKKIDYLQRFQEIVEAILTDLEIILFNKPRTFLDQLFKKQLSQKEINETQHLIGLKIQEAEKFLIQQKIRQTVDQTQQQNIADMTVTTPLNKEQKNTKENQQAKSEAQQKPKPEQQSDVQNDNKVITEVAKINHKVEKQQKQTKPTDLTKNTDTQQQIEKEKQIEKCVQNTQKDVNEQEPPRSKIMQFLENSDSDPEKSKIQHKQQTQEKDVSKSQNTQKPKDNKQQSKQQKGSKGKNQQIKGIIVQAEDESD